MSTDHSALLPNHPDLSHKEDAISKTLHLQAHNAYAKLINTTEVFRAILVTVDILHVITPKSA